MERGVSCVRDPEGEPTVALSEDELNTPETNIEDLPDECLLRILRCLGPVNFWWKNKDDGMHKAAVRNPVHCALVCKRWCALADLAVDSLHLPATVEHIPHVLKALARWRGLRRLDLGSCSNQKKDWTAFRSSEDLQPVLHTAASLLPDLQELRFEHNSDDLPDICTQACSLPHLTALELCCCQLPPLNSRSSEILHTLELTNNIGGIEVQESLGLFTGLESLAIVSRYNSIYLPTSIGQLSRLTRLHLAFGHLGDFPSSIANLTALRDLQLSGGFVPNNLHHLMRLKDLRIAKFDHFERLPGTVGELQHLVELELSFIGSRFYRFSEFPSWLVNVTSLQILRIRNCYSLRRLPADISAMASLREMELSDSGARIVSLPETFGHLNKLEVFKLYNLPSLKTLPEGLGECSSLTVITIEHCHSLGEWSGTLRGLTALQTLTIARCKSLASLPEGLGALGKLQSFIIRSCPLRELPEEIGNLSTLETLEITQCQSLLSLPPRLAPRCLDIKHCNALVSLPLSLGSQSLKIQKCQSLQEFPPSSGLQAPALEKIELTRLFVSLSPTLSSLISLKSLSLTDCPRVTELPESLGELTTLDNLHLKSCCLTSLPESLGTLGKLTSLKVWSCPLRGLPTSVRQLTSLQTNCLLPVDAEFFQAVTEREHVIAWQPSEWLQE